MKPFTGIWATFSHVENLKESLAALNEKNACQVTVHSPYALTDIEAYLKSAPNRVKQFALAGALVGALASLYFVTRMSMEWIQPLSAKPILSPLALFPIIFEVTIFTTVLFTLIGVVILTTRSVWMTPLPNSDDYKSYRRFTRDRFGLVVRCDPATMSELKEIFAHHQAEEIFIEE